MAPEIGLDTAVLAANARRWSQHARLPVWAVVKNDGYGWGAGRLASALNSVVEGFFVADADEALALRAATTLPIGTFAEPEPARIAELVAAGVVPTIGSIDGLLAADAVARPRGGLTVRVGLRPAAGWSGIEIGESAAFAAALARTSLAVELWTHLTAAAAQQRRELDAMQRIFLAAGVPARIGDTASTASAAAGSGARVRIGAGLFGARLGNAIAGLSCALRVTAPVVARHAPGTVESAGYANVPIPASRHVTVLRCGYGDGYPRPRRAPCAGVPAADILSMGMQYTVLSSDREVRTERVRLLEAESDIDALAASADCLPHEVIGSLGAASRLAEMQRA